MSHPFKLGDIAVIGGIPGMIINISSEGVITIQGRTIQRDAHWNRVRLATPSEKQWLASEVLNIIDEVNMDITNIRGYQLPTQFIKTEEKRQSMIARLEGKIRDMRNLISKCRS